MALKREEENATAAAAAAESNNKKKGKKGGDKKKSTAEAIKETNAAEKAKKDLERDLQNSPTSKLSEPCKLVSVKPLAERSIE